MAKGDQAISDHVKRIHSPKQDYPRKIRELRQISKLGPRPPVLVSDNPKLDHVLRRLELNTVLLKDREYPTIREALAQAYDDYRDPRMVLLGLPPLRWGSNIETFHPFADIDEDGYIELVVASLPGQIDLLTDHLLQAARAHRRRSSQEVFLVSQTRQGQMFDYLTRRGVTPTHIYQMKRIEELVKAELIIQVSDGADRIHGTPDQWLDSKGVILAGTDLMEQVEDGFRFANYPLIFSEACECGQLSGQLTQGFIRSLAVYIGNSMSTNNNLVAGKWFELLCGDGFKYGLIAKMKEKVSIFEIYREVVNLLVENANVEDKRILEKLLSNNKKIITTDAIQILTFNLFGLDRPSPLCRM